MMNFNKKFIPAVITLSFILSLSLTINGQYYTLQDDDVVVINGIIDTCTYNYQSGRKIIIPEILDGQTVTGIADKERGIFKNKKISSLKLPSTLEKIGDRAFFDNRFDTLVLPSSIKSIGVHAFSESYTLIHLDLSNCTNLETIHSFAFYDCEISSLDLSNCTSLKSIGEKAFNDNAIDTLALPVSIVSIGNLAFATNFIPGIDLTTCTALTSIGDHAFNGNILTHFVLPVTDRPGYNFNNWLMGGNSYDGGATVSTFATKYSAQLDPTGFPLTFTITDGTKPIYGVGVDLDIYGELFTSSDGKVTFSSVDTVSDLAYTISAKGFSNKSGSVTIVDAAVNESVTLSPAPTYNVNLIITDGTDPIPGASVVLVDYSKTFANASGLASFSGVMAKDNQAYIVNAERYLTNQGTINIENADVTDTVALGLIPFRVSFIITDGTKLLEGAAVFLEGYGSDTTNDSGYAVFEEVIPAISIPFSVEADGYITNTGTVTVFNSDLTRDVTLSLLVPYTVSFTVTDGTNIIEGATISLTGYSSETTDNSGKATFEQVFPEKEIPFTVDADGYTSFSGTITVTEAHVSENIALDIITDLSELINPQSKIYPNPVHDQVHVELKNDALISIINSTGEVVFRDKVLKGNSKINIAGLYPGIYYVKIKFENAVTTEKILVD